MQYKDSDIQVFFSVDDRYCPFLAVAIQSIVDNASKDNTYYLHILHTYISEHNKEHLVKYESDNIHIDFVNLSEYVGALNDKLYTRDYYSKTTYFRLFIPELFKNMKKALYIDSDIVVVDDIANLYNMDLGDNLVGAVPDMTVALVPEFIDYVERVIGVSSYKKYFNAGVMLMNLEAMREFKFEEKFIYMLSIVKYEVAQDQDYLNRMCKGRVKILPYEWNRMPIEKENTDNENIKLVHYNLAFKPWHFENILFQEYFWKYAGETEYLDEIEIIKKNFTEEDRIKGEVSNQKLIELAAKQADCVGCEK